jgi:4-carboxymuconolactone decarboxylase
VSDKQFDQGVAARIAMFGKERTDAALAQTGAASAAFQRLMTEQCFGALWADESIAARDRSLMTMALLAAQGKGDELKTHARLGLRNGVAPAVMVELVRHVAVYCGIPAGNLAARMVQEALDEQSAR